MVCGLPIRYIARHADASLQSGGLNSLLSLVRTSKVAAREPSEDVQSVETQMPDKRGSSEGSILNEAARIMDGSNGVDQYKAVAAAFDGFTRPLHVTAQHGPDARPS